jgi:transposase, IS5 family
VPPKAINISTNAKLLHAAIRGLNRLIEEHGVRLAAVPSARSPSVLP